MLDSVLCARVLGIPYALGDVSFAVSLPKKERMPVRVGLCAWAGI